MAFRTQKISQMTPKGANLEATDLIEVSTIESGSYVTRSITGQEIIDAAVGNVDWGDIGGTLSAQTDLQSALDAKVPTSRTLTINGVTQDLSADRTFTISTGITIGTTAIASGTVGRVLFQGTGNVVQQSSSLFWDATNNRLGIGTETPSSPLHVIGSATSGFDAIRFKGQYSETGYLATSNGAVYFASGAGVTGSFLELSSAVANLRGGTTAVTFTVGSERMRVNNAGNVLIGTTTDAGFRLDVNGTARVQTSIQSPSVVAGATNGFGFALWVGNTARMENGINFGAVGTIIHSGTDMFYNNISTGNLIFRTSTNVERFRVFGSTGNIGINTTTDAGYRLDVNGTARFTGAVTTPAFTMSSNYLGITSGSGGGIYGATLNQSLYIWNRQISTGSGIIIDDFNGVGAANINLNLINIGGGYGTSGTCVHNTLMISRAINMASGTQTVRGFYYNPTLTNTTGLTTHYAIHTAVGRIRFENLPTSSAGLSAGELWNDAGTLKIV